MTDASINKVIAINDAGTNLGLSLMQLILQELQCIEKPWQQMSQERQQASIDRVREGVDAAVSDAIHIIVSEKHHSINAVVESTAIKKDTRATLIVKANNNDTDLQELFRSRGGDCTIVLIESGQYKGGMNGIKPTPDQNTLSGFGLLINDVRDPLLQDAIDFIKSTKRPSISAVQRELRIGYNRAARMLEKLEEMGVVTAMNGSGQREVISEKT